MTRRSPHLLLGVAVLLAGCAVGPDYKRPEAISTPGFKELDGWKPAAPAELSNRGAWWSVFQDPDLDALEAQVEISNQTLRAAVPALYWLVVIASARRYSATVRSSSALSVSAARNSK